MKLRNIMIGFSTFGIVHLLLWWQPVFSGVVKGGTGTITSALGANPVTKQSVDQKNRSAQELFDAFTRLGFSPVDLARRQAVMRELCAADAAAACDALETLPRSLREMVCVDFCKLIAEVNPGAADVVLRRLSDMHKKNLYPLFDPLCMWHSEIIENIGDELYQYESHWGSSPGFGSRWPLNSLIGLVGQPDPNLRHPSTEQLLRRAKEWSISELEKAKENAVDPDVIKSLDLALLIRGDDEIQQPVELPEGNNARLYSAIELFRTAEIDHWTIFERVRNEKTPNNYLLKTAISMGIADPRWQEFGVGLLESAALEQTSDTAGKAASLASSIVGSSIGRGGRPAEEIAEIVLALPAGIVRDRTLNTLASSWVERDPESASDFIIRHPDIGNNNLGFFYNKLAENSLESPTEAAALALMSPIFSITDEEQISRETIISQILYSAEIQGIDPSQIVRDAETRTGRSFLESERTRFSKEATK